MCSSTTDQPFVPSLDLPVASNPPNTTTFLSRYTFTPAPQCTTYHAQPYHASGSHCSTFHRSHSLLQFQALTLPRIPSYFIAAHQVTPMPSPISGRTLLKASHFKPPILSPTIVPTMATKAIPKRHKRLRQQVTPYSIASSKPVFN